MLDVAPTPTSDATRPDPALVELKRPPSPLHASSPKRRAPSPSPTARTPSKDAEGDAVRPVDRGPTTAPQQAGPATCRLLWRGKVVTQDGQSLHGIAIIAHLFSVASTHSGAVPRFSPALAAAAAAASSLSPFDDPFSSASSAGASGADMCLGLEMLRGAPITAKGDVHILTDTAAQLPGSSSGGRDRKGKGKASEAQESAAEAIQVETPTDVRVYIDDRCPETVDWFQDKFCREGRRGYGVRFNAGGEEVVIFAKLPEEAAEPPTPSTSDATAGATLPGLTLLLGRPVRSRANQPRPDDPMPRENLFAKKLRKTASLPASAFPTATARGPLEPAPPPVTKRRRQSAKDKAIASLLGGPGLVDDKSKKRKTTEAAMPPPASRSKPSPLSSSSLSVSTLFGVASSTTTSRSFSRTSSTSRFSSVEPAHSGKGLLSRQTSLPPNVGLPLRRASSVSATATLPTHSSRSSSFQRSLSRSSMLLESPPGSEDEAEEEEEEEEGDGELVDRAFMRQFRAGSASARSRMGSRAPPSPTPSVMSLAEPDDRAMDIDGEGDDAESLDAVADLRAFTPNSNTVDTAENRGGDPDSIANVGVDQGGRGRKQMARSSSLPVGQFALASVGTAKSRRTRAGSNSSSVDGVITAVADVGESGMSSKTSGLSSTVSAVETRNKNTVKKITMNRMDDLGCGKVHREFKDIFSLTTRGVAFAMRSTFKATPLSTEERQRATDLIEKHLVMYMPVELFPLVKTLAVGGGGGDEPLEPGKPIPKQVEAVGREPPSPKSLGDHHLEESEPRAIVEQGEGSHVANVPETQVELEETQLEEEMQLGEETQLEQPQMAGQDGMDVEVAAALDSIQVTTQPWSGPSVSNAVPVRTARGDEEDVDDEVDEIILVKVPAKIPPLVETGVLS